MEDSATRKTALVIASLASFLPPFIGSSVNLALPDIEAEFMMDAITLGWVPTAYLLASAMFLLPFGRAGDIFGRKKIFTAGMFVYTLGALLSGLANSGTLLIASRAVQGLGSSMIFSTSVAILISVYPPQERGRVIGINVAFVYAGLSMGPFIGGLLTRYFGWRSVFLFNVPVGILIIALIFWKLKGEWAEAKGEKMDYFGSFINAFSMVLLISGLSRLPSLLGFQLFLAGIIGVGIFVAAELKTESPILDVRILSTNRIFAFSNLAALIHYSATFSLIFLLSLYLQKVKGLPPQTAGLIIMVQPVVMTFCSLYAGKLSDRVEPRIVASTGLALSGVGLFMISLFNESTSVAWLFPVLVLFGVAFALFSSPNTNAIMGSVERRLYGVASGMTGTMRTVGMMMSMGLVMMLFSIFIGQAELKPDLYPAFIKTMRIAFQIFGALCLLGTFLSLARGKVQPVHEEIPGGPS